MEKKQWQDVPPAEKPRTGKRQKAVIAAIAAVTALVVELVELPEAVERLVSAVLLAL